MLAALVEAYGRRHWPIEPPDAFEAIRYCMGMHGFTQADPATLRGSHSQASEILERRHPLTLEMIRRLHQQWGIPAESLLRSAETEISG